MLVGHTEKGVYDALVLAAADPYLDVAARAMQTLRVNTGRYLTIDALPDTDELRKAWAAVGPGITANSKPLECK
jgi:hypothetical protein